MRGPIEEITKQVKLSNEIEITIELRECGWHAEQRWKREIPAHSDRATLLKIVCKTHLSSQRGELTFQPPSNFVNMNVYADLFWDERWKHQV